MEKNRLKKISCIVALIMGVLLVITGCGSNTSTTSTAPTAESLAGNYQSSIDMTSSINNAIPDMLGEDYELDYQFKSELTADIDLVLNDDNTFSLEFDYKSLQDSVSAAMDAEGADFAKAIWTALGNNEDEFTDDYAEYMKEVMINAYSEESLGDTGKVSGTYELDGNKITFTGENSTMTANVDGDTLVVSKGLQALTGEDTDIIFRRAE